MKINFYATLRPLVGGKTVAVEIPPGATVQALIDELLARYPALQTELYDVNGNLYPHIHILVNGRDAPYLDAGLQTELAPTDTINIFPPVAGG